MAGIESPRGPFKRKMGTTKMRLKKYMGSERYRKGKSYLDVMTALEDKEIKKSQGGRVKSIDGWERTLMYLKRGGVSGGGG